MKKPLTIVITSGGTDVPIDSVRHISNMSTGRFGAQLARALLKRGHNIGFFMKKGSQSPMEFTVEATKHLPGAIAQRALTLRHIQSQLETLWKLAPQFTKETFVTYRDYVEKLPTFLTQMNPDIVISAAAISDYEPEPIQGKMSSKGETSITLKPTAKALPLIKQTLPDTKVVGFKLLVGASSQEFEEAVARVMQCGPCDMVAANDLNEIRAGKHNYRLHFPNAPIKYLVAGDDLPDRFAQAIEALA